MGPNILVIDDDPVMRRLISTILERGNYQVEAVPSVTDALDFIAQQRPDLVCCDLIMPKAGGLDFLERLHETENQAALPVIVISAAGEGDMINRAHALGAFGHLLKPFTRAQLLDLVESALRKSAE